MEDYKKINNIINQAMTDTNYVRDDSYPLNNFSSIIHKWIIYICIMFIIQFILNNINNISMIVRLTTIVLNIISIALYYYLISRHKPSIKEKDFLMLYSIIPILISFTYCISPISHYINADILLQLNDSLSLDLIILVMSSILLKSYIKDKKINKFIIYNCIIFIINIIVWALCVSINNPPTILTGIKSFMSFMRTNGLFIIIHYILILLYLSKKRDSSTVNILIEEGDNIYE